MSRRLDHLNLHEFFTMICIYDENQEFSLFFFKVCILLFFLAAFCVRLLTEATSHISKVDHDT